MIFNLCQIPLMEKYRRAHVEMDYEALSFMYG